MEAKNSRVALIYWVLALIFTQVFGFLAVAFLRPARILMGSPRYWGLALIGLVSLMAGGQQSLALLFGIFVVLAGGFTEFESRGYSILQSGTLAVVSASLFLLVSFLVAYGWQGSELIALLKTQYESSVAQINGLYQQQFDRELLNSEAQKALLWQLPSIGIVAMILSLFIALVLEVRLLVLTRVKIVRRFYKLNFFKVHDVVVWLFMFSLLGTFFEMGVPEAYLKKVQHVSANVLNISVLLLLLQGLAVVSHFFETFKVASFWRVLWFMVLVVHLSLGLVLVGLLDYWFEFRKRFRTLAGRVRELEKKHSGRKQ